MFFVAITLVAVASLIISIISSIAAFTTGSPKLYWLATLSIYVFSMLSGFSIGKITVGFAFVLLLLAIGSSINALTNRIQFLYWLSAGLIIGLLMIFYVDDMYLFFPMRLFELMLFN